MTTQRNQHRIDQTLNTMVSQSDAIEGTHIATYIGSTNAWAAAQVEGVPNPLDPDFEPEYKVVLEQAIIPESRAPVFTTLVEFDQAAKCKIANFPVNRNSLYRFRHLEGDAVYVLMAP